MPRRSYKPLEVKEDILQHKSDFLTAAEGVWDMTDPKQHHFLSIGQFQLVKSEKEATVSQITVITPEKKKSEPQIPKDYAEAIEDLKNRFKFTLKEIKSLSREIKRLELLNSDLEERIKLLEEKAVQLANDKAKQKTYNNFVKKYEHFYECLSSELVTLPEDMKSDIKDLIKNISSALSEVEHSLG